MNIGFTGTREGMTEHQRKWFRYTFMRCAGKSHINIFHHGDCMGADDQAHSIVRHIKEDYASFLHISIILHTPIEDRLRAFCHGADAKNKPLPYLKRNDQIAKESDHLIACPLGPEILKSGTWHTVRCARRRGVPITIIWPDGRITEES